MKCNNCHRKVQKRDRFCPHCGARVVGRQPRPQKAASGMSTNWPMLAGAVLVGVLIGAVAMYMRGGQPQAAQQNRFDPRLHGPQLAAMFPLVYQVASQFTCPCGTCDDGLELCDCEMENGAAEARAFIYAQLQAGHKPFHVIELVEQRYGHRKGVPVPNANAMQQKLKFQPKFQIK